MSLDQGKCRSCGQTIFWGVTKDGKKCPLDPPEKRYIIGRSGKLLLLDSFLSLFVTCPNANQHRKRDS